MQPARSNFGGTNNGYGYGGPYNGNSQGYSASTNPAQQALAQSAIGADTRAQASSIDAQQNQRLAALQTILRTTTVQPGPMYGGVIEVARPRASSILNVHLVFAANRAIESTGEPPHPGVKNIPA